MRVVVVVLLPANCQCTDGMEQTRLCSRDDCPTANLRPDCTTNCGKCSSIIHLQCIGIFKKTSEILINSHIKVFCMKCARETSSPPPIDSSKTESKATSTTERKIDAVLEILDGIKTNVENTKTNVELHRAEAKSYAETLYQVKASVNRSVGGGDHQKAKLFSSVLAGQSTSPKRGGGEDQLQFPPLGRDSKRRKTGVDEPMPKAVRKTRPLTAGTGGDENHELGSPVRPAAPKTTPRIRLPNSIYVSRLQPSVDVEQMRAYIKRKVPEATDDEFDLRLLVKKDQVLDTLTFVSFRLLCADKHVNTLTDSNFWPSHVMIGNFLERPRPKQQSVPASPAPSPSPRRKSNQSNRSPIVKSIELGSSPKNESSKNESPLRIDCHRTSNATAAVEAEEMDAES